MRLRILLQYFLVFNLILLLSTEMGFGQTLSKKEKEIIHTEAYDIVKRYETILNKIAQLSSTDEAQVTKLQGEFIQLFLNRQVQVYNDLEPSHQYSEFYEVETYISNLVLWYPDGMNIILEHSNIQTPGIKAHKDNIWFIDLQTKKTINGNYMNRTLNNNKERISFRIAFVKNGKKVENFQIVGIRNALSETKLIDEKSLRELNKAEYSTDELIQVQNSAKSLVMDYQRSLEMIGNPEEKEEYKSYFVTDFLSLFESEEAKVYNDIEPEAKIELLDIKTYIENYQSNYVSGIGNLKMNTDSATFTHIEETDDGKFQTYVYVEKFFSAKFKDKQMHTAANPIIFTISLDKKNGAFQNLKIKSIDREYTDFSGINIVSEEDEVLKPITPISRLGNSVGFSYMGGISKINNQNLNELSLGANNHEWNTKPLYGFSAGLDFLIFFKENLAFVSGIKYSQFETNYQLNGNFGNSEMSLDPNNKSYIDSISANLDSIVSLKYIGIPIGISYVHDFSKKISIYANIGINISYLFSSEYKKTGTFNNYGYYPSNDPPFQIISEPELGFRNEVYEVPETGPTDNKTLNIIGELEFGISFKTGYYSTIQLGPKILYGLSSVTSTDSYTDIFNNSYETKPTRTNNFGFEITYIQKL